MKVIGYARVSTTEQSERGLSLGEQEAQIRELARQRGWDLADVVCDRGVSGSVPFASRPAGRLAHAAALPIVVTAWDRLGRDAADFLAVVRDREVVSVTEEGEPPLLRDLRAVLAQEERRKIQVRNRAAASAMFRTGRYNGPPVFGYDFAGDGLVPNPVEAEIVRSIFTGALAGRTLSEMARDLNRRGIRTKRDGIWRQSQLSALIRNPVYAGMVRLGAELAAGQHEAILDERTWQATEQLLAARSQRRGKGAGRPPAAQHLFVGGLLRCGECGQGMAAASRGDCYRCQGQQALGCEMPTVPRRQIDAAAYAYFEQVGLDVEATREAIAHNRDAKLREVAALLSAAEGEAQRADERLTRVRRDYADGKLSADDWASFRDELGSEREAARAEVGRLRTQRAEIEDWATTLDAERETLHRLAQIRAAILGEVREADGTAAVRAALGRLFDGFTLHRAGSSAAPPRLHAELAMGVPGFVIEPHVREQAIAHAGGLAPVLYREPLEQAVNNQQEAVGYEDLLQPIEVAL